MTRRTRAIVVLSMFAAACSEPATSVTGPTVITVSTEHFTGTLVVRGAKFFSFGVTQGGGTVSVMLASVTSPATGAALPHALGLGLGIPAGTGCALSHSLTTPASLTTQLSTSLTPGIYCVSVYDPGTLPMDVNFALRFLHP
jgi:hypothetical protein